MTDEEIIIKYLGKDIRASGDFCYSELLELMASARAEAKKKMLLTIISKKHDLCESCFEELEEAINEVELI